MSAKGVSGPVAGLVRWEPEGGARFNPVLRVRAHPHENHRDDSTQDSLIGSGGFTQVVGERALPHQLWDVIDAPSRRVHRQPVVGDEPTLNDSVGTAVPTEQLIDRRP